MKLVIYNHIILLHIYIYIYVLTNSCYDVIAPRYFKFERVPSDLLNTACWFFVVDYVFVT
jgi:hypothetical protein